MKTDRSTDEFMDLLMRAKPEDLPRLLRVYADEFEDAERPFSVYIRQLLREKGLRQQEVFLAADIPEGYGYKLLSEEKHTRQRDVILRIGLAGHLTLDEIQHALGLYGMCPLYPRRPRDAVFIVAFSSGTTELSRVETMLEEMGLEKLYICK